MLNVMHPILHTIDAKLKKIPRKHIKEALLVVGGLFLVAWLVSFISPYTPTQQYNFYESEKPSVAYMRAEVLAVSERQAEVRLLDGPNKAESVQIPLSETGANKNIRTGSTIIVISSDTNTALAFYSQYRIPFLVLLVAIFIAVVLLVGRRKGLMSLAGLGAGVIVIGWGIIPLVLAGYNALLVSVSGAFVIAVVSILLAHGFNKRTYISLLSVLLVLVFVTVTSQLAVSLLGLTGIIDEASFYLQLDHPEIDIGGILVGGIVIAALGALDDIVTTQVATVYELKKTKRTLTVKQLYTKAAAVGSEHIAALVNTLVLAVPISTWLAAVLLSKKRRSASKK